jgi:hypothetical protein
MLEDIRGLFGLRPAHADHAVELDGVVRSEE